jgi:hypothetical protein
MEAREKEQRIRKFPVPRVLYIMGPKEAVDAFYEKEKHWINKKKSK